MKCLITGASGFVGRELVSVLKQQGHFVVEAGRKNSGLETDQFVHITDISASTLWVEALESCDVVVHLAARVHVMQDTIANSLAKFQDVNLYGTANLARQAVAAGVRRFVYISSIKVNGEATSDCAFSEVDAPNPQDPYALSKWQAESELMKIGNETGMEIVILRPPLIYGPYVKANFFNLLKLTNKALPLPLGSIKNSRSMIFIRNLVDILTLCITHPLAAGKTYLVSDGVDISTPQLIRGIADAMGIQNRIFPFPLFLIYCCAALFGKLSVANRLTQSLQVDISKITSELGWQPRYTLKQGLQITADWFVELESSAKAEN